MYGQIDACRCLLENGANSNIIGTDNNTPLHKAMFAADHCKISKILIEFNPTKHIFADCDKQNLPPNKPSSLTSEKSSSSITLTWTDSQTEAVTGYKVRRKTVNTDNYTTVSTITDNTIRTYADDNVSTGGTYWYRVRAYNSNGDGTPSMLIGPVQR